MAFACGTLPVWPMMTMKRPPPCRRMCGATLRASSHGPTTLVWKCRSSVSVATPSMRPGDVRAGIAHHDVDAAERLDGVVDQRGDVGRLADVGDEAFRLGGLQRRDRLVELAALAPADRDAAAFLGETLRDGEADAAGAAGDQRDFAGESEIHAPHPKT